MTNGRNHPKTIIALVIVAGLSPAPVTAAAQGAPDRSAEQSPPQLTPGQLFDFADRARDRGDFKTAAVAYRALATNPDVSLRNEARFRHALMLADKQGDFRGAAVLLRRILDEQPGVARVRLELARMQARMGNLRAAERELRAAQAAGLPPEVERQVRFFASSLSNQARPFGVNLEVALAPDSNINRATAADTLETVIGEFDLSDDAQAQSGLGLAMRGQAYARIGVEPDTDLLARVSASGRFYREGEFGSRSVSLQLGPQYRTGTDRINVSGVVSWSWFGGEPLGFSYGATADYRHPLAERTQLRIDGAIVHNDDRLNDLRSVDRFTLGAGVDHAFSARTGGGVRVSAARELANDPGYSEASGGVEGYVFRELGRTTAVLRASYDRRESDARLFLYPRRRIDDRFEASLSGTFRALSVGSLAPLARVSYERNISTVGIFDYRRVSAEVGVTAAF